MSNCAHCFFWKRYEDMTIGQCRRLPPVTLYEERKDSYDNKYQQVYTAQSWTDNNDWCGEWRKRTK